jgi:hypothetical protein
MSEASASVQDLAIRVSRLEDAADLQKVQDLFSQNGFPRASREVEWIYEPLGRDAPHAAIAEAGEATAGLYVTVPARFKCGDRTLLAAQSLDTMVDAKFRGFGLFTKLARAVYDEMARSGVAFVYGFPNGNSYPGFVQKLGWATLDPVPFLFRPLSLGYAFGKLNSKLRNLPLRMPPIGRRGRSEQIQGLPDREAIDTLWANFSRNLGVARVRDHEFLSRRYSRHPRAIYRYRAVIDAGKLAGLIIYCVEDKHGGRIGYVMELMCIADRQDCAGWLLADAVHDMSNDSCDGVLAWCLEHSPYYDKYLKQIFLPMPTRLRPIELHFGGRQLSGEPIEMLKDRKQWYLSYSDSDTV